jgi:hypothetical protein
VYKNSKILALISTVIWLLFVFSAFKGFHFWYAGFVFFFWLALAALNYRHRTSLWMLKNYLRHFLFLYGILLVVGFHGDYIIGQVLTDFWRYPYYTTTGDWVRLYTIIYPFGGLVVLELVYFLSWIFGEHFRWTNRHETSASRVVTVLDRIFLGLIFISPIMLLLPMRLTSS